MEGEKEMWENILRWLKGIGSFMVRFLSTTISDLVDQIGDDALAIVIEVERSGVQGAEAKFAKALQIMIMKFPDMPINAIRIAIENAVAIMREEK